MKIRNVEVEQNSVYDNLGYFPVIYYMHIGVVWTTAITVFNLGVLQSHEIENYAVVGVSIIVGIAFSFYVYQNRPSKIKSVIEQNRKIWSDAFQNLTKP